MGQCLDFWTETPAGSQPCESRPTGEQAASDGRIGRSRNLSGLGESNVPNPPHDPLLQVLELSMQSLEENYWTQVR